MTADSCIFVGPNPDRNLERSLRLGAYEDRALAGEPELVVAVKAVAGDRVEAEVVCTARGAGAGADRIRIAAHREGAVERRVGGVAVAAAAGVDVDRTGNVHISGFTQSGDLATTEGAHRSVMKGPSDAWYSVLAPDLSSLKYSSFFGGSDKDRGRELVCGPGGRQG